ATVPMPADTRHRVAHISKPRRNGGSHVLLGNGLSQLASSRFPTRYRVPAQDAGAGRRDMDENRARRQRTRGSFECRMRLMRVGREEASILTLASHLKASPS